MIHFDDDNDDYCKCRSCKTKMSYLCRPNDWQKVLFYAAFSKMLPTMHYWSVVWVIVLAGEASVTSFNVSCPSLPSPGPSCYYVVVFTYECADWLHTRQTYYWRPHWQKSWLQGWFNRCFVPMCNCVLCDVAATSTGQDHSVQLDTPIPRPTGDLLCTVVRMLK